jgi:septal ring factor EnvC (AmiA/AmiB activator)
MMAGLRGTINEEFDQMMISSKDDLAALVQEQEDIEAEQDRLLDAYLSGDIPQDAMGRRQRALQERVDEIATEITVCNRDYFEYRTAIDDCL